MTATLVGLRFAETFARQRELMPNYRFVEAEVGRRVPRT